MFTKSGKNQWALFLLLLAGIVIGSMIGFYLGRLPYLGWLNFGQSFGIDPPMTLELGVIKLTFGLYLRLNIAGVIGVLIAIFTYKKL